MATRKQKINAFRRKLTRKLTSAIVSSKKKPGPSAGVKVEKILICRPNARLGNLLLITPLIQEVTETFPGCKIDLFVKGNLAPILFQNYENIDRIIKLPPKPFKQLFQYINTWFVIRKRKYDLVINVIPTSSSGRISTKIARSKYKLFVEPAAEFQDRYNDYRHIAKHPVYAFREYTAHLRNKPLNAPIPSLNLGLSEEEIGVGRQVLKDLVKNDRKTIGLFTYATGEKRLSKDWWEEMYAKLQTTFPEYNIIEILPKENVSQISFKAPSYYSRDIREIGAFMYNTSIFIGADSGMMHLACASQTPTIGLFSITKDEVYTPYRNKSIAVNTENCSVDECLEKVRNILN